MITHEGLTGVDRDVECERVISIRQMALSSYAISVPQLEAAECRRVLFEAYLVDEHVWR